MSNWEGSLPNWVAWSEHLGCFLCGLESDFYRSMLRFPGDSVVKNLPANSGDAGLIHGLGRSLEKEMLAHSSSIFA